MMNYLLRIAILFIICSCDKPSLPNFTSTQAFISNDISVDGCSWHISISENGNIKQFAFSDIGKSKVDEVIKNSNAANGLFYIPVLILYQYTGKNKDIPCGFGKTSSLIEIEILDISKR